MAFRSIALFAGSGMLDVGVSLATGGCSSVVCYVEREAFAAATLVARMEEGSLDPAPIWSDVATFRGMPWRGRVDLITGGFPCQDISNAGKRAGLAGARSGLWFEYARIIEEVEPDYVFIENVSALRSRGGNVVLGDLAALGFDAEWDCFRASDVGAPHRRERIFILAHRRGVELRNEPGWCRGPNGTRETLAADPGQNVAYYDHDGRQGVGCGWVLDGEQELRDHVDRSRGADAALGHTHGSGLERRGQPVGGSAYERTAWPPGPEDLYGWRYYLRVRPDAEPSICGKSHGVAGRVDRTDRLRLCGNGVVPQVAALAFLTLHRRLST